MWKRLLAVLFVVALVAAACGDDDQGADVESGDGVAAATDPDPAATDVVPDAEDGDGGSVDPVEPAAAADLELAASDLGQIVVDADGLTVYLFVPDDQGDSTCYDQCEANWPVVGELSTVGDGLDASLLGTTARTTGDSQATYNGWPLYYFAADAAPGDTAGQGLNAVWYVLDSAGNAIGVG